MTALYSSFFPSQELNGEQIFFLCC